jgi:hypothetical protein
MAHLVSLGKGKHQAESSGSKQPKKKFKPTKNNNNLARTLAGTMVCSSSKHLQKQCLGFMEWLKKKGNDFVSFVDEYFLANYSPNTWWIDSGANVHISNLLQIFNLMRTIRRGERSLKSC